MTILPNVRSRRMLCAALVALVAVPGSAHAGATAADPTWGDRGMARAVDASTIGIAVASDTASDGSIAVAGARTSFPLAGPMGWNLRVHPTVHRFRADGTPDPTFGQQGTARIYLQHHLASATAVDARDDGRVLVAGANVGLLSASTFVARLRPDGSLDESFGNGGSTLLLPEHLDALVPVAVQELADGSVHVVATSFAGDASTFEHKGKRRRADLDVVLVRFTADGQLDRSWGSGGLVEWDAAGSTSLDVALTAIIDGDGATTIAGASVHDDLDRSRGLVARFTPTGALDPAFGSGGLAPAAVRKDRWDVATALTRRSDGGLLVAQLRAEGDADEVVTEVRRFNAAGRRVAWRGSRLTAPIPGGFVAGSLLADADGGVVAGGIGSPWGALDEDGRSAAMLARIRPDGTPDRRFDQGGVGALAASGSGERPSFVAGLHRATNGAVLATGTFDGIAGATRLLAGTGAAAGRVPTLRARLVRPLLRGCGLVRSRPCHITSRRVPAVSVRFAVGRDVPAGHPTLVRIDRDDFDGLFWEGRYRTASVRADGSATLSGARLAPIEGLYRIQAWVPAGHSTRSARSAPFYVRVSHPDPDHDYDDYDDEEGWSNVSSRRACASAERGTSLLAANARAACAASTGAGDRGDARSVARRILGR